MPHICRLNAYQDWFNGPSINPSMVLMTGGCRATEAEYCDLLCEIWILDSVDHRHALSAQRNPGGADLTYLILPAIQRAEGSPDVGFVETYPETDCGRRNIWTS
jgi:hypothetical protein